MSDERNIQEARRRLKECQDSHELCGQAGLPPLPRRVIDVGNSDNSQTVNIHFSLPDERGSYTALSYCWGKVSQMTSTVKSIGNLENGVPLSHMSKTVQDAVEITRALGIRYLWVDALCIIQDSPGDIAHEIGSMGNIYKNATLTIVAAHSEGAHLGFIGRNAPFEGWRAWPPHATVTVGYKSLDYARTDAIYTAFGVQSSRYWMEMSIKRLRTSIFKPV